MGGSQGFRDFTKKSIYSDVHTKTQRFVVQTQGQYGHLLQSPLSNEHFLVIEWKTLVEKDKKKNDDGAEMEKIQEV